MLKFVITTKEDLREAAKLEQRRQYEEERKKRIFNGKRRLYGLDYEALEKQIAEKTKQKVIEAERERRYNEEALRQANLYKAKEIEQQKIEKLRNMEMNYYRCRHQRRDLTREFDITNPNAVRISEPVRRADDDTRLGISSAQIFLGEDLHHADRKRAQKDQQRAWLDQQMKERQQADIDRKTATTILDNSMNSIDQRLVDMSVAERENRTKIKESIRRYNEALAMEKRENMKVHEQQTQEDNLAEIYNMLGSDMLNENPELAGSNLSANKKNAVMFRGMTPAEAKRFRDEQNRQIEQNEKRRNEEKLKEKMWEQQALNTARELTLKHMELQKIKKAQLEDQYKTNMALAQEQKARRQYMDKVVYRNQATDDYWGQFNRTSR